MQKFTLKVDERNERDRLDRFLAENLKKDFSRSYLQKLILNGDALINGRPARNSTKLKAGDTIELTVPEPKATELAPEEIPLDIVYEDDDLLVVNKPAGMVVHPAAGNRRGTLVNALLFHCKNLSGINGRLRPGIVHRLDKDTTGLIVIAKNDRAHSHLANQFKKRSIKRRYIAFVRGVVQLDNGTIELPIGRDRRDRQKMAVGFTAARPAITRYRVLKRFTDYTMLELVLGTGRTHQIRTHMEYIGHPLLGDKKYGKSCATIRRHALHAATLGFRHPATGKFLEFTSELPEDMKALA